MLNLDFPNYWILQLTGLGPTVTAESYLSLTMDLDLNISSLTYDKTSGIGTVTTVRYSHGLVADNTHLYWWSYRELL